MSSPSTIDRPTPTQAPSETGQSSDNALAARMTLRLDELAHTLGVSRRTIERERSAGRFPKPDVQVGRMPLWRPETILAWIERGGRA